MKLVTVEEMRSIESAADRLGVTYAMMMEQAGIGLAGVITDRFSDDPGRAVLGLVGTGNNGGDALVALERLADSGWTCSACLVKPRPGDILVDRLVAAGGEVFDLHEDTKYSRLTNTLKNTDILVDGLLGTGAQLPLREDLARLLARIKKTMPDEVQVVAVDCPSGVDCETGATAPECLPANVTACMAAVKTGLLKMPAYSLIGEITVVDIGLPDGLDEWRRIQTGVMTQEDAYAAMPRRPLDSHKGTFGTVMVVAGSVNYPGAAALAGRAAYRVGTGLVRLAVPGAIYNPLVTLLPEAVFVILPHELGVISTDAYEVACEYFSDADAILLGPGFGLEETSREFIEKLIAGRPSRGRSGAIGFIAPGDSQKRLPVGSMPPLIIDADALKLLARIPEWWKKLPPESILTPHPGEMAILTGIPAAEIQQDRLAAALRWAAEWQCVVVLKGAFTVIAAPDGRAVVIPVATSALATAGTGDVLAGALAGLRAQGVKAYEAACTAAWMHAKAGEFTGWQTGASAGVLAGEVADALPFVLPPDA